MTDLAHERARTPRSASSDVAALQVEGLSVQYGQTRVLNGLNLAIRPGEIFGLLGPNGAGKTTLVRTICGRIGPASGQIRIAGQKNSKRAALRRIGLVPQEIALYPHLTARENLMAFGQLSGLSRKSCRDALRFAMKATRLDERADSYIHTLSGGWKRRANIAAALLHRPSLLILDEPTVGVDVDARNALHEVIRDLGRSGLAVLLATHDLDQAQSLCERVGFLRRGTISPSGRPDDLLKKAFGDNRVLLVDLFEHASKDTRVMLRRIGFQEHPSGLEWSRMIDASAQKQAALTRALHQTDLHIKEIRFREPGLDTLFLKLARKRKSP
ncbi:ABC transporter ATP-binding protein [Hoeflea prorocentri]|uniref:ABC transporter ATP-binding protein n=1 Tax=Hoeflea prorocentri TaxID=1922333 RepID=A0A9X3ZHA1_9HYPH|nr:ABC transporter ATP-binding protein [Hoeflea prorocentri]MDA5398365.1 ABC transporter ATP-binding protein [Hoeflea prorocentri]